MEKPEESLDLLFRGIYSTLYFSEFTKPSRFGVFIEEAFVVFLRHNKKSHDKTLEKGVNILHTFSTVSVSAFEQVNVCWVMT